MDEYSVSLPTGTTPFKMWRCCTRRERDFNYGGYSPKPSNPLRAEEWIVGQYLEPIGDRVPIRWFDVVLRYGPKPPYYAPPDWSNYARWKRDFDAERAQRKAVAS